MGPPKTNPSSGREEDLNPGPPDYKSSTQPFGHPASKEEMFPVFLYCLPTGAAHLVRGIEWSLKKNHGSWKILGESRNLGVAN